MCQAGISLSEGSLPQNLQAATPGVLQKPVQGHCDHLSCSVPQRLPRQLVLCLCSLHMHTRSCTPWKASSTEMGCKNGFCGLMEHHVCNWACPTQIPLHYKALVSHKGRQMVLASWLGRHAMQAEIVTECKRSCKGFMSLGRRYAILTLRSVGDKMSSCSMMETTAAARE